MLQEYMEKIKKLEKFEKEDLLNEKFILEHSQNIKIYYAPHNELINKKAKILIVGITPGWTQTQIAYKTANQGLRNGMAIEGILRQCKYNSRFSGSMRKNLIEMLDEIGLNKKFYLKSCSELFEKNNELMHTTSLIKYPVFVNEKNYNGHNPEILKNDLLMTYIKKYFVSEINELNETIIIPLGKAVEEVLIYLKQESLIDKNKKIMYSFPHPSGANGHRKEIFQENKQKLIKIVNEI